MWIDLRKRRLTPEWMDQPDLDPVLHHGALSGLARLNRFSRSAEILWRPIRQLARAKASSPLRVLDLACGSGRLLQTINRRAARQGLRLEAGGCDASETALAVAKRGMESDDAPIEFFRMDVLRDPLPTGYDVVMCSLFLHHLEDEAAEAILRRMA